MKKKKLTIENTPFPDFDLGKMARHLNTAAMMSVLTIDAAIKNKMAAFWMSIMIPITILS